MWPVSVAIFYRHTAARVTECNRNIDCIWTREPMEMSIVNLVTGGKYSSIWRSTRWLSHAIPLWKHMHTQAHLPGALLAFPISAQSIWGRAKDIYTNIFKKIF